MTHHGGPLQPSSPNKPTWAVWHHDEIARLGKQVPPPGQSRIVRPNVMVIGEDLATTVRR